MNLRTLAILIILVIIAATGCATSSRTGVYNAPREAARNTTRAEQLTRQAADLIDDEPDRAERLLREALTADLYYGPAHNNLGILFLQRSELYEAAHEFEWARKLAPGHPQPRMNLALTLERAGRIDEAMAAYDAAIEVYPNHLPSIQGLTRAQLRYNRTDDRTRDLLREIALRGDESWRQWARSQLARLD